MGCDRVVISYHKKAETTNSILLYLFISEIITSAYVANKTKRYKYRRPKGYFSMSFKDTEGLSLRVVVSN